VAGQALGPAESLQLGDEDALDPTVGFQEWAIRSLCSSRALVKEWKISQLSPTLSECLGMRIALVHAEEWLWDQMRRTEIVFRYKVSKTSPESLEGSV
jgi:hypothetical protein